MSEAFAVRTRERLREEIIAVASDEVVARGWRGLRMQVVADAVGVSRQTIYNEFVNKQGLAEALVISIGAQYADECERIIEDSPDLRTAIRDSVRHVLDHVVGNETFKAVMAPEASDTFLPLYATGAVPLVSYLAHRMVTVTLARWPELDPDRVRIVMEISSRNLLSNVLMPQHPPEQVAEESASLFGDYLAVKPD